MREVAAVQFCAIIVRMISDLSVQKLHGGFCGVKRGEHSFWLLIDNSFALTLVLALFVSSLVSQKKETGNLRKWEIRKKLTRSIFIGSLNRAFNSSVQMFAELSWAFNNTGFFISPSCCFISNSMILNFSHVYPATCLCLIEYHPKSGVSEITLEHGNLCRFHPHPSPNIFICFYPRRLAQLKFKESRND